MWMLATYNWITCNLMHILGKIPVCLPVYYQIFYRSAHNFHFLFRQGSFESVTSTHALLASLRPLVFPLWHDTLLWILMVLALYPNWWTSGLSLCRPSFRWLPKYSSTGSWQNLSVKTNSIPSLRRNLVHSMTDFTVIFKPSCVCQDMNMRDLAFWLYSPGLLLALSFHDCKYS